MSSFRVETEYIPRMQILVVVAILVSLDYSSALTFTQPDDAVNSTLAQDIDTSRSLKKLSRSKRYMSFPEGSSFSVKFPTNQPDATFLPSNAINICTFPIVSHRLTDCILFDRWRYRQSKCWIPDLGHELGPGIRFAEQYMGAGSKIQEIASEEDCAATATPGSVPAPGRGHGQVSKRSRS